MKDRPRWPGWVVMFAVLLGWNLWQSERQRIEDAKRLREMGELKALVMWAAVRADSR